MSDPIQTSLTDRMIARLEEANTRSYKQLKGADESSSRLEQDATRHPSDPKRRPSRARLWLFVTTGMVLAATVYVQAFVWEPSYGDAVKLLVARWANASVLHQPTRRNDATPDPVIPSQVERRLERMATELADAQQQIARLKVGQDEISRNNAVLAEQSKAGQEQMVRENAKVAAGLSAVAEMAGRGEAVAISATEFADVQHQIEQLKAGQDEVSRNSAVLAEQFKAGQEQMARDNAKAVDELNAAVAKVAHREEAVDTQIKAVQEQLAEAASFRSANAARKPHRRKRGPSHQTRAHH